MTSPRSAKRFGFAIVVVLAAVAAVLLLGVTTWAYLPEPGKCVSCHEIQASADSWADSAHRKIGCSGCHGGTFTYGWHGVRENARRVAGHFAGSLKPEEIRLSEDQIVRMMEACAGCHGDELAGWEAGRHDLRYGTFLLNTEHNRFQPPNEDCLRCHGMYFEGTIRDLVTPIDTIGPWRMTSEAHVARPAIPCQACHQVHLALADGRGAPTPGLGWYDRNEGAFFPSGVLPVPTIQSGTDTVRVSAMHAQRLCMQCHAPAASHQAGTADDRTPRGVHEGIGCVQCHDPHRQDTAPSCAGCHPALSNCGLDVETMDTTFRSTLSTHNIHFVSCLDCHPGGAPGR